MKNGNDSFSIWHRVYKGGLLEEKPLYVFPFCDDVFYFDTLEEAKQVVLEAYNKPSYFTDGSIIIKNSKDVVVFIQKEYSYWFDEESCFKDNVLEGYKFSLWNVFGGPLWEEVCLIADSETKGPFYFDTFAEAVSCMRREYKYKGVYYVPPARIDCAVSLEIIAYKPGSPRLTVWECSKGSRGGLVERFLKDGCLVEVDSIESGNLLNA